MDRDLLIGLALAVVVGLFVWHVVREDARGGARRATLRHRGAHDKKRWGLMRPNRRER